MKKKVWSKEQEEEKVKPMPTTLCASSLHRIFWIVVSAFFARLSISTWNTVKHDCGKESKCERDSTASVNFPPKICIPRSEKMKMKRKRMTSSELMEEIEFTRDLTRFPIEAQYLEFSEEDFVVGGGREGQIRQKGERKKSFAQ